MPTFKPTRRFSRRLFLANFVLSWGAVFFAMWIGDSMAAVVVPAMVAMLVGMYGFYTGVGHLDLRAITRADEGGR
jgi:uncharacterized membrane protein YfbV (UPF0208 family)